MNKIFNIVTQCSLCVSEQNFLQQDPASKTCTGTYCTVSFIRIPFSFHNLFILFIIRETKNMYCFDYKCSFHFYHKNFKKQIIFSNILKFFQYSISLLKLQDSIHLANLYIRKNILFLE